MRIRRIAVTGGPGGGKTSLWRELSRAYGERVIAVPEVATLLFQHVFPAVRNEAERHAVQRAIFHVQRNLEAVHAARSSADQVLLCDRGTPDGGGYWPHGHDAFFAAMDARKEEELARYDAVLFLESAAAGGLSIAAGNPVRVEDVQTAAAIDRRLREVWSSHPNVCFIAHEREFAVKLARGVAAVRAWIEQS